MCVSMCVSFCKCVYTCLQDSNNSEKNTYMDSNSSSRMTQVPFLGKSARFAYSQSLARFCGCVSVCVTIVRTGHILAKTKICQRMV